MELSPGFDKPLLTSRERPADPLYGIDSKNSDFILIVGVKVRPMVRRTRFGIHADDDSEEV